MCYHACFGSMKRRSITRKVDIKGDTKLSWICAKEIVCVRLSKMKRERKREREREKREKRISISLTYMIC